MPGHGQPQPPRGARPPTRAWAPALRFALTTRRARSTSPSPGHLSGPAPGHCGATCSQAAPAAPRRAPPRATARLPAGSPGAPPRVPRAALGPRLRGAHRPRVPLAASAARAGLGRPHPPGPAPPHAATAPNLDPGTPPPPGAQRPRASGTPPRRGGAALRLGVSPGGLAKGQDFQIREGPRARPAPHGRASGLRARARRPSSVLADRGPTSGLRTRCSEWPRGGARLPRTAVPASPRSPPPPPPQSSPRRGRWGAPREEGGASRRRGAWPGPGKGGPLGFCAARGAALRAPCVVSPRAPGGFQKWRDLPGKHLVAGQQWPAAPGLAGLSRGAGGGGEHRDRFSG